MHFGNDDTLESSVGTDTTIPTLSLRFRCVGMTYSFTVPWLGFSLPKMKWFAVTETKYLIFLMTVSHSLR
jgi:hypothetical protein